MSEITLDVSSDPDTNTTEITVNTPYGEAGYIRINTLIAGHPAYQIERDRIAKELMHLYMLTT